jgi:hypothetical protein
VHTVHALSFHRTYRCAHAGVCCSSGWPIAVEAETAARIATAIDGGQLDLSHTWVHRVPSPGTVGTAAAVFAASGMADAASAEPVLAVDRRGHCALFEPASRLCAVHRQLGDAWLPGACRHFPRVAVIDPRGVRVSLSHYCPTAARLLLDPAPAPAIEANPPGFPPDRDYEGLDATDALPPLLRPGVLHTLGSYSRWEAFLVSAFGDPRGSVEAALGVIATLAEDLRAWAPAAGPLEERVARLAERHLDCPQRRDGAIRHLRAEEERLAAHVRGSLMGDHSGVLDARWVRPEDPPGWTQWQPALQRYAAARAFASAIAYEGAGVRTAVRALAAAIATLRAAAWRVVDAAHRPLDAPLLVGAAGLADLVTVHLAHPVRLRSALDGDEGRPVA